MHAFFRREWIYILSSETIRISNLYFHCHRYGHTKPLQQDRHWCIAYANLMVLIMAPASVANALMFCIIMLDGTSSVIYMSSHYQLHYHRCRNHRTVSHRRYWLITKSSGMAADVFSNIPWELLSSIHFSIFARASRWIYIQGNSVILQATNLC